MTPLAPEREEEWRQKIAQKLYASCGLGDAHRALAAADVVLTLLGAAVTAKTARLAHELAVAEEELAFLHRNSIPAWRRATEHQEAGKKRWRERAELAEAAVASGRAAVLSEAAELVARHTNNLFDSTAKMLRREAEAASLQAREQGSAAVEYGVRVPDVDGEDGDTEVLDPSTDLGDTVARLGRYRDTWPTAALVRRSVAYSQWADAPIDESNRASASARTSCVAGSEGDD